MTDAEAIDPPWYLNEQTRETGERWPAACSTFVNVDPDDYPDQPGCDRCGHSKQDHGGKQQTMRDTTIPKPPAVGEVADITASTVVECGWNHRVGTYYRAVFIGAHGGLRMHGGKRDNFQDAVNDALEMGKA